MPTTTPDDLPTYLESMAGQIARIGRLIVVPGPDEAALRGAAAEIRRLRGRVAELEGQVGVMFYKDEPI